MAITASQLRQDIYRLLDQVLSTGEPLEIERKGRTLRLVPDQPASRLSRIRVHPDVVIGDPELLVSIDWSAEWDERRALHP
jgi:hypothetical protein